MTFRIKASGEALSGIMRGGDGQNDQNKKIFERRNSCFRIFS